MTQPPRLAADDPRSKEMASRVYALRAPLARFFARRVADASEVEDLVQEVFVRMLRRGPLDHSDRLTGYVFQTADSVWKDRNRHRRSRRMASHVTLDPEVHGDVTPGPEAGLLAKEALRASSMALLDLPELTRTVFLLRRLDHMPFAEIARRLGMSLSAAEKHMLKAARHLAARALEESQ